jgi:hypothetical protein
VAACVNANIVLYLASVHWQLCLAWRAEEAETLYSGLVLSVVNGQLDKTVESGFELLNHQLFGALVEHLLVLHVS